MRAPRKGADCSDALDEVMAALESTPLDTVSEDAAEGGRHVAKRSGAAVSVGEV